MARRHQGAGASLTQQKTIDERRPSPSPWRSQKCDQSAHGHAASHAAWWAARRRGRARGPGRRRGLACAPGVFCRASRRARKSARPNETRGELAPKVDLNATDLPSRDCNTGSRRAAQPQLCNHHAPPAGARRRAARRGARPAPSAAAGVPARARRVRGRQDARGVDRPHGHRPLELPHQGGAVDRVRPAHAAAARQRDGGRGGVRRRARPGGGRGHRRHPRPAAGRRLDAAAAGQRRAVHRPRHRVRRPAGAERVARDVPARRALRRPVRRRGAPERPLPRLRPDGDLVRAASGYPAARTRTMADPPSLPSACAGCCRR